MKNLTIGIIGGRGTLGKIFKKFFRKHGFKVLISGRKTRLTSIALVKKSDVVIFSVPINATAKVIREVLPYTKKEQLLMDFTSIKEEPIREMLKSKASVIGLHPMFGKIESLKGKTIIIVPARPRKWMKWLVPLLKKGQISIKTSTAKKHDKIMAVLQGLIHFNFMALSATLKKISKENNVDINDLLEYGGVIYRIRLGMITRILSQDPELYADIAMLNKNTKREFEKYVEIVQKLNGIIGRKDKKEFKNLFNDSALFFGRFKGNALKESSFLIEQFSKYRKKK
jgi:prephenate dehydrogenase